MLLELPPELRARVWDCLIDDVPTNSAWTIRRGGSDSENLPEDCQTLCAVSTVVREEMLQACGRRLKGVVSNGLWTPTRLRGAPLPRSACTFLRTVSVHAMTWEWRCEAWGLLADEMMDMVRELQHVRDITLVAGQHDPLGYIVVDEPTLSQVGRNVTWDECFMGRVGALPASVRIVRVAIWIGNVARCRTWRPAEESIGDTSVQTLPCLCWDRPPFMCPGGVVQSLSCRQFAPGHLGLVVDRGREGWADWAAS